MTAGFDETFLTAKDGTSLYVRAPAVHESARAQIVLTHGRGEYSGRYSHVSEAFAAHGLALVTFDLRGHGRSGGKRGDTPSYAALLEDLDCVVRFARSRGGPLFLFGHSLGGQIALNYLHRVNANFHGALIASPYLRLAFRPERWRLAMAGLLRWIWPSITLRTHLPFDRLSRDIAHLESLPDLDLMHHRISVRKYEAIKKGAIEAFAGAAEIRLPILLLPGADDPVTSMEATREFHAALGATDKTLAIFPGMLHETHNEIGRAEVLRTIIEWVEARLGS